MPEIFIISDSHFGHKNIIKFHPIERPFTTIEEHDAELIKRWNKVVGKNDIVFHLGDFAMAKKHVHKAGELNGKKRLIMGNHDIHPIADYALYFDKIYGVLPYKGCILTHMPIRQDDTSWELNVHGHLHNNIVMSNEIVAPDKEYPMNWEMRPDPRYLNVSCERVNLTPINFDLVNEKLKELRS